MAGNLVDRYQQLINNANEYHKEALWQEKLRSMQEALAVCDELKQGVLYDVAGIWRRLGQYDKARQTLQESLDAYPAVSSLFKSSVQGELGVMARHNNQFHEAREAFREQGRLARESPGSLEADAEICRAVGNEGMATYNIWQHSQPKDPELLAVAITQMRERISRAQDLQSRLREENPSSKYLNMAETWEIIGLDRLSVLHVAAGDPVEAVRVSTESQQKQRQAESQQKQKRRDPTVVAFSKFFYGHALWHNGQKSEAVGEWNAPNGTCSSPMALCKEPSEEHNEYLQLMANSGVDFDTFDEGGFTALDHAILGSGPDAQAAVPIIHGALHHTLMRKVKETDPAISEYDLQIRLLKEIHIRERQAQLRRQYRTILQEHIRPELRVKTEHSFRNLRAIYANYVSQDNEENRMFSKFQYVKFLDFKNYKTLPKSSSNLAKELHDDIATNVPAKDDFVIFFSYRWIGDNQPDDNYGSQWRRMVSAVEDFLKINPDVQAERLGLWLDYACIDQENEQETERGVDALPLAVTQCNALISLVDEAYYTRAWCVVEVMLIRALQDSYGMHKWWEHVGGSLREGRGDHTPEMRDLKLTKEELDRPRIDFLLRQSKLLGKDDA